MPSGEVVCEDSLSWVGSHQVDYHFLAGSACIEPLSGAGSHCVQLSSGPKSSDDPPSISICARQIPGNLQSADCSIHARLGECVGPPYDNLLGGRWGYRTPLLFVVRGHSNLHDSILPDPDRVSLCVEFPELHTAQL